MQIEPSVFKEAIKKKGYIWFEDKPNIIAIRTRLQIPNVFNDPLVVIYKDKGVEKMFTAIITTEPGVTYQKKLLNAKGCWVMMPAQMIDAYSIGYHQGKTDHKCLKSSGRIYGLREDDGDGILFNDKTPALPQWVDGTTVGANMHGANKNIDLTTVVGPWSAGCQVFERWSKKEEMIRILETFYPNLKKFTYTLLEENDFL